MAGSNGVGHPRFEVSMQRDIDHIKLAVSEMSALAERALQDAMQALFRNDRRLAFSVILRDRLIDGKEQALNQICLEFLVRQQPVGQLLRMAYAAIRISLELERVGDYAESIARRALRLAEFPARAPRARYEEMSGMTIAMLRDSVNAFVTEDADLARRAVDVESTVDGLKADLGRALVAQYRADELTFDEFDSLMNVNRRLERTSDQARNICHEVIYMCTGHPTRHQTGAVLRVLFVDDTHGCLSQMAQAIGEGLGAPGVVFASAGIDPQRLDAATIDFMRGKGLDLSPRPSRAIREVPELDQFQVVVAFTDRVRPAFPPEPRGLVYLDWRLPSPVGTAGSPETVTAAYEATYARLTSEVAELVRMIGAE